MKIRHLLLCAALVATAACNRREDANKRAGESAETARDKAKDLVNAERERNKDIVHSSADLAKAETDFALRRDEAVAGYRAELRVFQLQASIARGLLADRTLAAADRATATDRVMTFERECNTAEQSFDALATATSAQWDSASTTARDAMQKVRDANDDAFSALSANRKIVIPPASSTNPPASTTVPKTTVPAKPKYEKPIR